MTPLPERVLRIPAERAPGPLVQFPGHSCLDTAVWTQDRCLTQVTPVRSLLSQELGIRICSVCKAVKNGVDNSMGEEATHSYTLIHSFTKYLVIAFSSHVPQQVLYCTVFSGGD